jgi:uncharacterized protein (TIGR00661 family)
VGVKSFPLYSVRGIVPLQNDNNAPPTRRFHAYNLRFSQREEARDEGYFRPCLKGYQTRDKALHMKIVYGISGFGNGHVARSAAIIRALLARGHRLVVFGFNNSERYITQTYPDIPVFRIKVPVLHPHPNGLDFGKIADDPANHYPDGIQLNYRAMQNALDYFDGPPDVVLSDYELVAAQFAYATLVPLVSIDQHSKFVGFEFPDIGLYSRREDYSRLNLFFPQATARFASTFFKVNYPPNPAFPVTLIPPILREDVMTLADETTPDEVLVYLSPFARIPQPLEEVYRVFERFPHKNFHVFLPEARADFKNIYFHVYNTQDFLEHLARAEAVISTAGHTLLSELVYLKKPMLVAPSGTFDQHTCAQVIATNQLGTSTRQINEALMRGFFQQLAVFRKNLEARRGLMTDYDGIGVLMRYLHDLFGI